MRIRTVKPEFWRSDDITQQSREHRLLFIGLWSYVDDNGVGIDDYRQIAADLFAFEDDQTEIRDFVREGLARLADGGLIVRYEADGKRLLHIVTWKKHQRVDRPNNPRYPLPPCVDDASTCEESDDSQQTLDGLANDSRETPEQEQRNRGTKDMARANAQAALDAGFAEFWDEYPRKEKKPDGRRAYLNAIKKRRYDHHTIMSGLRRHITAWRSAGTPKQYVPHPASWLNQDRFNDQPTVFGQTSLSAVPDLPLTFEAIRERGDAASAAKLLDDFWTDPPRRPSDTTPHEAFVRRARVAYIDENADRIRDALARRQAG